MHLAVALAALAVAVLSSPATARADDALIETGALEASSLAGGEGWVIWAVRQPEGLLRLRGLRLGGTPVDLPAAPLSQLRAADIGRGAAGRPTAVYEACRGMCGVFSLDLARGVERRIALPRPPRGCRHERPVVDRRVYVVQTGLRSPVPERCREGIYELRRPGRLTRRQPGRYVYAYDITGGRLAYQHQDRRGVTFVHADRAGRRPPALVTELPVFDGGVTHDLAWSGRSLHVGVVTASGGSYRAWAYVWRVTIGARVICRKDARSFTGPFEGATPGVPTAWAFSRGHIYYTIDSENGVELRQRTDPPPRYVDCF
jgi:hypothetical protein